MAAGVDAEAVIARARALPGCRCRPGTPDAAALLDAALRAGILDARRNPTAPAAAASAWASCKSAVEELGGHAARSRPSRAPGTRFVARAAADAGDHRRADRAGRRRDVRRAAGRGARGDRGRRSTHCVQVEQQRDDAVPRRARCRSCGCRGCSASPDSHARSAARCSSSAPAAAAVGHRGRSHRRPARDRRARDRRSAGQGRRHFRRDRPRRRPRRADPRSGGAGAADARAARSRRSPAQRSGRMTGASATRGIGSYILFTVAGTTYALPSARRPAHRDGRGHHARAERAAVRRRRRVLARPGGAGRQPARALRVRARALRPAHAG